MCVRGIVFGLIGVVMQNVHFGYRFLLRLDKGWSHCGGDSVYWGVQFIGVNSTTDPSYLKRLDKIVRKTV